MLTGEYKSKVDIESSWYHSCNFFCKFEIISKQKVKREEEVLNQKFKPNSEQPSPLQFLGPDCSHHCNSLDTTLL